MVTLPSLARALGTRRGRLLIENVTAYLFLAPAGLLILLFGIFPVAFAFFVSLHRWRRFPDEYVGIGQLRESPGQPRLHPLLLAGYHCPRRRRQAGRRLQMLLRNSSDHRGIRKRRGWLRGWLRCPPRHRLVLQADSGDHADPASGARPKHDVLSLFMEKLGESFAAPEVYIAGNLMLAGLLIGVFAITLLTFWRFRCAESGPLIVFSAFATTGIAGAGIFLLQLTMAETGRRSRPRASQARRCRFGRNWSFISAGIALIAIAWLIFQRGIKAYENRRFILLMVSGLMLAVGGYLLMAEAPAALAAADDDLLQGFLGHDHVRHWGPCRCNCPLACCWRICSFQPIRFRAFFRMVYFIPYITPFVATSIVFRIIFDAGKHAPANRILSIVWY